MNSAQRRNTTFSATRMSEIRENPQSAARRYSAKREIEPNLSVKKALEAMTSSPLVTPTYVDQRKSEMRNKIGWCKMSVTHKS